MDVDSSSDDMDIDVHSPKKLMQHTRIIRPLKKSRSVDKNPRKKTRLPRERIPPKQLRKSKDRIKMIHNEHIFHKQVHDKKKQNIIPDFMDIDIKHNPKIYDDILYKSKKEYNLTIPILDKYGIEYETWNNPDNTSGTCFWHATSKALHIPMDELSKSITVLKTTLPSVMRKMYKTRYQIAERLDNYRTKSFGVSPRDFCMVPKLSPDTALIVFFIYEDKPKHFISNPIGVKCYAPDKGIKPTKVVFMCNMAFLNLDKKTMDKEPYLGHIEIMTLKGKRLQHGWTQNLKSVAPELKKILTHHSCKFIE